MSALPLGTQLGNERYRLDEVIGRGGFGITYRALDREAAQFVAIKECFPHGCERGGDLKRVCPSGFASNATLDAFREGFREQSRRLRDLHHAAIVPFRACFDENGTSYLVMDLLEGPTLLQRVERGGPVEWDEALGMVEPLADALRAIHDAGWLHLDIKPENAILVKGAPVLVDFDLLSPRDAGADHQTRPLALAGQIGTPGYAPLEQYALQAPISPATDVYALGATLYHLLSGQAPLSAVDRAAGESLPSLGELTGAPKHAGEAVERALELQSTKRPQSVAQFWEELQTPIEPEPDPDAPKQQVASHSQGFYRIVLTQKDHAMPAHCVCCYASKPNQQWLLCSPSGRWHLPLCEMCQRHHYAARASGQVTFWGMGASLLLALAGVGLSVISRDFFPIFLCLAALILCFGAMSYGALKSSAAGEMMSDFCCDSTDPATYIFNGRVHIWKFRNSRFAEDFRDANAQFVV